MKRRALLSVDNKDGIDEFGKALIAFDFEIFSSGGTARALAKAGVAVTDVSAIVGGEAILGDKVKTLSRPLFAEILADYNLPEEVEEMKKLGRSRMDLVCVDMYPLIAEIAKAGSTLESVTKKTDIGGPTMLRAAAKGGRIVICDQNDRVRVIDWLKAGEPENGLLAELRAKAEFVVAQYAAASATYLGGGKYTSIFGENVLACKYGENAPQTPAGLYSTGSSDPLALDKFKVIEGTPPSYNNWCDLDRLLQTLTHIAAGFEKNFKSKPFIAVGGKHGNACGASYGFDDKEVVKKMLAGDPLSIFGGLAIFNFVITAELAELFVDKNGRTIMLDGIIAAGFSPEAIERLKRKGNKCRFIENPDLLKGAQASLDQAPRFRYVRGGFLRQPNYTYVLDLFQEDVPADQRTTTFSISVLDSQDFRDTVLAWAISATSNSNTISIVKDGMLIGNAVGQQDRVGAAKLAIERATRSGHDLKGSVASSDSFFPFPDGPEVLINAGVETILTTSGSVKDPLTVVLCRERGVNLIMVPDAIGRGFFGH